MGHPCFATAGKSRFKRKGSPLARRVADQYTILAKQERTSRIAARGLVEFLRTLAFEFPPTSLVGLVFRPIMAWALPFLAWPLPAS
jgi:hypothetical protein